MLPDWARLPAQSGNTVPDRISVKYCFFILLKFCRQGSVLFYFLEGKQKLSNLYPKNITTSGERGSFGANGSALSSATQCLYGVMCKMIKASTSV